MEIQMPSPGRPRKYEALIRQLDPNTLYSPAAIAKFALRSGYISRKKAPEKRSKAYQQIRIAMASFSRYRNFPIEGDGFVFFEGQPPARGWLGKRWQNALEVKKPTTRRKLIAEWQSLTKFVQAKQNGDGRPK